jgi:predicted DNA-binding ribbon-helix-helix protein
MEDAFWAAFKDIAAAQSTPVSHLLATIDSDRRKCHTPIFHPRSVCSSSIAALLHVY